MMSTLRQETYSSTGVTKPFNDSGQKSTNRTKAKIHTRIAELSISIALPYEKSGLTQWK